MDLSRVDHLIIATPDVAATVDWIEDLTGVRATPGGRHPAWSTHNAIIPMGPRCYLEILGPDPSAPPPAAPRPLDLDARAEAGLATWVASGTNLVALAAAAASRGIDLGVVEARSRERDDGQRLSWTMTDVMKPRENGIVPFFIDWGDTPHPGAAGPARLRLRDLHARHPDATRIAGMLRDLGLDMHVEPGPAPELLATLATPKGTVRLGG